MTNYYPDGTGPKDLSAPWNAKDPTYRECPKCLGEGVIKTLYGDLYDCNRCEGKGCVEADPNEDDNWI